mmetsp:Transcript_704/g.1448  ORF Transcript_704/g.1448 Transcript_704/m.1448 type:complete len:327 (+) Transcript_704:86-1066(+)
MCMWACACGMACTHRPMRHGTRWMDTVSPSHIVHTTGHRRGCWPSCSWAPPAMPPAPSADSAAAPQRTGAATDDRAAEYADSPSLPAFSLPPSPSSPGGSGKANCALDLVAQSPSSDSSVGSSASSLCVAERNALASRSSASRALMLGSGSHGGLVPAMNASYASGASSGSPAPCSAAGVLRRMPMGRKQRENSSAEAATAASCCAVAAAATAFFPAGNLISPRETHAIGSGTANADCTECTEPTDEEYTDPTSEPSSLPDCPNAIARCALRPKTAALSLPTKPRSLVDERTSVAAPVDTWLPTSDSATPHRNGVVERGVGSCTLL